MITPEALVTRTSGVIITATVFANQKMISLVWILLKFSSYLETSGVSMPKTSFLRSVRTISISVSGKV